MTINDEYLYGTNIYTEYLCIFLEIIQNLSYIIFYARITSNISMII